MFIQANAFIANEFLLQAKHQGPTDRKNVVFIGDQVKGENQIVV